MARTTGSEDLYSLIHSLTKEEKGYFKKFATRHTVKGNNYLKLFDAINRQTEFEEESLKKTFKGYAGMKVYLFEEIMRSLIVYLQETDVQVDLLQKAVYCSVLQKKGLERRAIQLNKSNLKTAESHELFLLQEFFLRNDVIYAERNWKHTERMAAHQQAFNELQQLRAKQDNKDQYSFIANFILNYGYERTMLKDSTVDFETVANVDFLRDKERTLSKSNNRSRLYALGQYYKAKEDYTAANHISRELFAFEESLLKNKCPLYNGVYYAIALQSLISSEIMMKNFENLPALLEKLLQQTHREKRVTVRDQYFYCLRSLDYYWRTGRHKAGLDFFIKAKRMLETLKKENRNFTYALFLLARKIMFDYSAGNYTQAILGIADMHAMDIKQHAPQFVKQARWIELLIHFNTSDYNAVKETAQKLLKKEGAQLAEVERMLCKLFMRINDNNGIEILESAKNTYSNTAVPIHLFESIELISGFEAALTGKKLAEVVKGYFKK